MAILNAPGKVYSAVSGREINTSAAPEPEIDGGEEYFTFQLEAYADIVGTGSGGNAIYLHGPRSWVDWGDGHRSEPEDLSFNTNGRASASHTFQRSDVDAHAQTIPDERTHFDGSRQPLPHDPERTVRVITITVHTMYAEAPSNRFILPFEEIRTLRGGIPVHPGALPYSWLDGNGDSNHQFRAPDGVYNYRGEYYDVGSYSGNIRNKRPFFAGTNIAVLPSLFTANSALRHIENTYGSNDSNRNSVFYVSALNRTSSANDAVRVLEGYENHTLGSNIETLTNFSYANFSTFHPADYGENFQGLAPDISGVKVINNYRPFRNLSINLANAGNQAFLANLFSAIDASNNPSDHPFYFDMGNLEVWIDDFELPPGDRNLTRVVYTGFSSRSTPQQAMDTLANMRPFTPPLTGANRLHTFIHNGDHYGPKRFGSNDARDMRESYELCANFFGAPMLPQGGSLRVLGGHIVSQRLESTRENSKALIVYSAAEWAAAGVPSWVREGRSGAGDYLIYRSIPSTVETVLDFNGGNDGHIFCTSDRTQIEYSGNDVITRLTAVVPQPGLPEGVRYVLGYYRNFMLGSHGIMEDVPLYADSAGIGESTEIFGLVDESSIDPLPGGNIVVPALPTSTRYIQDFMPGAFIKGRRTESSVSSWMRYHMIPVSPERIYIELNHMPYLQQVVGWLENAYAGYWQISRIAGRENDFIPVIRQQGVSYTGIFTEAFACVGFYNRVDFNRTTRSLINESSQVIEDTYPGEQGTYLSQVPEGIRYAASRRIYPLSIFNGMPSLGPGNFQGAFNGNWYGNLGSMAAQHGISAGSMLATESRGFFETGSMGDYPGPGIKLSNGGRTGPVTAMDTENSLDF